MKLDHIMYASQDLDSGIEEIRERTGVQAEIGGSHPGAGTRNALLSFGGDQYLEIIAPDPAQTLTGTLGEELSSLAQGYIRTWAVAVDGYSSLMSVLDRFGYGHNVIEMSRTRPDGVALAWQILFVTRQPHGLAMPFFIDWLYSPHPALVAPAGCGLDAFSVQCPDAVSYQAFCEAIGLEASVSEGELKLSAKLQTPSGTVELV